jgi:redox-sensitive bicupin YhaK (pirin superfamily)
MSFIKIPAREVNEGVGAKVKRLFPTENLRNFDPFVLFDHFSISPPAGFPDHPHRGFEIITLVLEGALKHTDDLGNSEIIEGIGVQRITVGRGIVHSEMPAGKGLTEGIQLWINLPRKHKKITPFYQKLSSSDIPVIQKKGLILYRIAGKGTKISLATPVEYTLLFMEKGSSFSHKPSEEFNTVVYILSGEALCDEIPLKGGEGLLACRGTELKITARGETIATVISGKPIGEPILQRGPFVD